MNRKQKYFLSTAGYGIFAVTGFAVMVYFLFLENYLMAIISLFVMLVAIDNFFCGCRARKAGFKAATHYAVPFFLKKP